MKNLLLAFSIILLHFSTNAQVPTVQWETTLTSNGYQPHSRCVISTNDGGFAVTGINKYSYWLSKLNTNGELIWEKEYTFSDENIYADSSFCVIETNDGGFAIMGSFEIMPRENWWSWNYGLLVLKLDENGELEWKSTIGDYNSYYLIDDISNANLVQTADDGFLIPGNSIYKLDKNGELKWEKDDDVYHRYFGLSTTNDNGFIAVGYSREENNYQNRNIKISKFDVNNEKEWDIDFGGSEEDYALAVKQNQNGDFLVVGHTKSNDGDIIEHFGNTDILVLKISANGQIIWQKTIGGLKHDVSTSIDITTDNGCVIAGYEGDYEYNYSNSQLTVFKLDINGNIEWEYYGDSTITNGAFSVIESSDLNYVIAGFKQTGDNYHNTSGWVLKLSSQPLNVAENINRINVNVFPNPSSSLVYFENVNTNAQLNIYDLNGKLLINQAIENNLHSCNIAQLNNGVYFYTIHTMENNVLSSGKIVKN